MGHAIDRCATLVTPARQLQIAVLLQKLDRAFYRPHAQARAHRNVGDRRPAPSFVIRVVGERDQDGFRGRWQLQRPAGGHDQRAHAGEILRSSGSAHVAHTRHRTSLAVTWTCSSPHSSHIGRGPRSRRTCAATRRSRSSCARVAAMSRLSSVTPDSAERGNANARKTPAKSVI